MFFTYMLRAVVPCIESSDREEIIAKPCRRLFCKDCSQHLFWLFATWMLKPEMYYGIKLSFFAL